MYEPNLLAGVGIEDQNPNAPNLNLNDGSGDKLPPLIDQSQEEDSDDDSDDESYVDNDDMSQVDEDNLEDIPGKEVAELLKDKVEHLNENGSNEDMNLNPDVVEGVELSPDGNVEEPVNPDEGVEDPEQLRDENRDDTSKNGNTIGDSAPDLMSKDDLSSTLK